MKLLDLYCKAGGAAAGYARAGFTVTGVDHEPQPNFPYEFIEADALEYVREYGHLYDCVHASPPCQAYSTIGKQQERRGFARERVDLVEETRQALIASGKPYVIENVRGAPLHAVIQLCGSSFGLDVRRHRLFETSFLVFDVPCDHSWQTPRFRSLDQRRNGLASVVGVHGHNNYAGEREIRQRAMQIDWMNDHELAQAIPPRFTEYIGTQLAWHLQPRSALAKEVSA